MIEMRNHIEKYAARLFVDYGYINWIAHIALIIWRRLRIITQAPASSNDLINANSEQPFNAQVSGVILLGNECMPRARVTRVVF